MHVVAMIYGTRRSLWRPLMIRTGEWCWAPTSPYSSGELWGCFFFLFGKLREQVRWGNFPQTLLVSLNFPPQKHQPTKTRWWFQIFFCFNPNKLGKMIPFWRSHIFQMGWFNHQATKTTCNARTSDVFTSEGLSVLDDLTQLLGGNARCEMKRPPRKLHKKTLGKTSVLKDVTRDLICKFGYKQGHLT